MKSILKLLLTRVAHNDAAWNLLNRTLIKALHYVEWEREKLLSKVTEAAMARLCESLVVRSGPFLGMKYPHRRSVGSAFFPKLLGSYERELHPLFEKLCLRHYEDVVDVGCAEGYYAVGMALRMPSARVLAFDTDPAARTMCEEMAACNGVRDRVIIGAFCDASTLQTTLSAGACLVICDCEGYEKQLFAPELMSRLAGCDVLVEVHDFVDPTISATLRERFGVTHDLQVVHSIDDDEKAQNYNCPELNGYEWTTRKALLSEARPRTMEWFYFTPVRGCASHDA